MYWMGFWIILNLFSTTVPQIFTQAGVNNTQKLTVRWDTFPYRRGSTMCFMMKTAVITGFSLAYTSTSCYVAMLLVLIFDIFFRPAAQQSLIAFTYSIKLEGFFLFFSFFSPIIFLFRPTFLTLLTVLSCFDSVFIMFLWCFKAFFQ